MGEKDLRVNRAVAAAITGAYREAGLTLPTLAERSGISDTTVQRIAAGTVGIKVSHLVAIAGAVGLTAEELFERALKRLDREALSDAADTPVSLDETRIRKQREAAMMPGGTLEDQRHAATTDPELDTREPEAP